MPVSKEQQRCIETLDRLVAISTGAGSGKTFTLTQRIAYAFETGFVEDIDQVLAITFTEKAANELRSRIKFKLKGLGYKEQADKCDSAWISTIHGMCLHILKLHGIELGADPEATLITSDEQNKLMSAAIEEVLQRHERSSKNDESDELVRQMIDEYRLVSHDEYDSDSIFAIVYKLAEISQSSVNGLSSLKFYEAKKSPSELFEELLRLSKNIVDDLNAEPNISRTLQKLQVSYIDLLQDSGNYDLLHLTYKDVVRFCSNAKKPPKTGKNEGQYKHNAVEYKLRYMRILQESTLAHAARYMPVLVEFAEEVCEIYEAEKRAGFYFDNNDLIVNCYHALKNNPELAQAYKNQFKIIMVDEFQDTDFVQFAIIKMLANDDMSNICMVGDSQQSIYRFRGADVGVYKDFVENLSEESLFQLSTNFRSDQNILSFVEKIFSQDRAFGDEFLKLREGRVMKKSFDRTPSYNSAHPRVQLHISSCQGNTASKDERVRVSARAMAERFAKYAQEGFKFSDFAVLLGGMNRAHIFEEELRRLGFPCVVTGGSMLSQSFEAHYMKALAKVIANPHESEALYTVLASPMFCFNTQDFMLLCDDHEDLDSAFFALAQGKAKELESKNSKICLLAKLIHKYAGRVQSDSMVKLMSNICIDCGMFSRFESLGVDGNAQAGNVLKIIRIVEAIENDFCVNHLSTAGKLEAQLAYAKLAPGSISTEQSNFVKIMTVHASKGLEFPIVAVAALKDSGSNKSKLWTTRIAENIYSCLGPGQILGDNNISISLDINSKTVLSALDEKDKSELANYIQNWEISGEYLSDYANTIDCFEEISEAQEEQRLLYVALTRAEEAVALYLDGSYTNSREGLFIPDSLPQILSDAIFGSDEDLKEVRTLYFDFGGTETGLLVHDFITEEFKTDFFAEEEASVEEEQSIVLYRPQDECEIKLENYKEILPSCYSYSKLAGEKIALIDIPEDRDDEWGVTGTKVEASYDADKASEFGSAFHALMQFSAMSSALKEQPSEQRISLVAKQFGLDEAYLERLKKLIKSFFSSIIYKKIAGKEMSAEESFFFDFEMDACQNFFQGEIDLLLPRESADDIEFVDYKTGGKVEENMERMLKKYELQAKIYAYALLKVGYKKVKAKFIRVECLDAHGQPQVFEYEFELETLDLDFDMFGGK
ncbi:MAG: UvrD-helicase domain-containing protein [Eggerthellaceae bacterium]|nr:UvrD-helicase domain-containing protein [Eggerthellaceae bacterium]